MRLTSLIGCVLAASSVELLTTTFPVFSETKPLTPQATEAVQPTAAQSGPTVLLPASTVISVVSSQGSVVEVTPEGSAVSLVLAQPITDTSGATAIYAGTPVMGRLVPTKGGAEIVLENMVINNRLVPFQASSVQALSVSKVPVDSISSGANSGETVGNATRGLGQVTYGLGNYRTGSALSNVGGGLSQIVGLFGNGGPKKVKVVELPAGQPFLLLLKSSISVPVAKNPPAQSPAGGF